jgi:hypothetical protein
MLGSPRPRHQYLVSASVLYHNITEEQVSTDGRQKKTQLNSFFYEELFPIIPPLS